MAKTLKYFKSVRFKQASGGNSKTVTAIVTAPTLDRDGDVVDTASILVPLAGGQLIEASKLTGSETIDVPLQTDHNLSVQATIGSAIKAAYTADGELEMTFKISSRDIAQEMFTLLDEGHLKNAFSIGFMFDWDAVEGGVIKNVELIEVSLVVRGSNRNARMLAISKSLNERISEVDKQERIKAAKAALEAAQAELDAAEADAATKETETNETKAETEDKGETKNTETPKTETKAEDKDESAEKETKTGETEKEETDNKEEGDVVNKTIKAQATKAAAATTQPAGGADEFDKVEHAAKQFRAYVAQDAKALAALNKEAKDTYKQKEAVGAMQTAVVGDGGAVVPSAQLMADVFSVLGTYSQVAEHLTVVTLESGNSIDYASLIVDVIMQEVGAEGGDKQITKMKFAKGNVAVREFAGIAVMTKKLIRQASVDIYSMLVESFARAIARKRAEMALVDSNSGIYKVAGVKELDTDADIPTWAEIKKMVYAIPAEAVSGAQYYISRELLAELDGAVDSQGRDLDIVELDGTGLSGKFKNGYKFAVEDSLGKNKQHAVFGSMSRYGRLVRQGIVEHDTFFSGEVKDDDTVHNAIQQNKVIHRAAFYENVAYPIPGAFVRTVNS